MRFVLCLLVPLLAACEAVVVASNAPSAKGAGVAIQRVAPQLSGACLFDASYAAGRLIAIPVIGPETALFMMPPAECIAEVNAR